MEHILGGANFYAAQVEQDPSPDLVEPYLPTADGGKKRRQPKGLIDHVSRCEALTSTTMIRATDVTGLRESDDMEG